MDKFIKLPRIYVDQEMSENGNLELPKDITHYLKNVMRRQEGDLLRVFNGRHGEWLAEINEIGKKSCQIILKQILHKQPENGREIHLLFAPIKKARMDFLIEKAIELGATDLHPVITMNTEVRDINETRIQKQIIEASEQSERLDIARLHPLQKLDQCLSGWTGSEIFCALERQDAPVLSNALSKASATSAAFLIGPEGGFASAEIETISNYEFCIAVSLGARILRAETAALACLAQIS